jgi:hypothetical protein
VFTAVIVFVLALAYFLWSRRRDRDVAPAAQEPAEQ